MHLKVSRRLRTRVRPSRIAGGTLPGPGVGYVAAGIQAGYAQPLTEERYVPVTRLTILLLMTITLAHASAPPALTPRPVSDTPRLHPDAVRSGWERAMHSAIHRQSAGPIETWLRTLPPSVGTKPAGRWQQGGVMYWNSLAYTARFRDVGIPYSQMQLLNAAVINDWHELSEAHNPDLPYYRFVAPVVHRKHRPQRSPIQNLGLALPCDVCTDGYSCPEEANRIADFVQNQNFAPSGPVAQTFRDMIVEWVTLNPSKGFSFTVNAMLASHPARIPHEVFVLPEQGESVTVDLEIVDVPVVSTVVSYRVLVEPPGKPKQTFWYSTTEDLNAFVPPRAPWPECHPLHRPLAPRPAPGPCGFVRPFARP